MRALIFVLLILILCSCAPSIPISTPSPGSGVSTYGNVTIGSSSCPDVIKAIGPPTDGTRGLAIKRVDIDNMHGGATFSFCVPVYNYLDEPIKVKLYYKYPDRVDTDNNFNYPPAEAKDWVKIGGVGDYIEFTMASHEMKYVGVTQEMPMGQSVPKKWEYWIGFGDVSKSFVQCEMACIVYITMR